MLMNNYSMRRGGSFKGRLLIALVIAIGAIASYYGQSDYNDITGEEQRVAITTGQEIALGLQAAPQMTQEYGGLDNDPALQLKIDTIGKQLISESVAGKKEWTYEFHLLADRKTINAFALPGGQVFITRGLFNKLQNEAQVAAVLAHEIAHVVARHGAQALAKQQLAQGLSGAAGVAAGDYSASQMAMMASQLVTMRYGRDAELQSDALGVRFMSERGYDPRVMIEVMKILADSGSKNRPPEFFSTHPNPENRIAKIEEAIQKTFPTGVPDYLKNH